MLHEEDECVLLKESNMEDPLADPLDFPSDNLEQQDSQTSESESSEKSEAEEDLRNEKPQNAEDIVKEQVLPFECDVCEKKFKSKPGEDFLIFSLSYFSI
jgi:hypothetical protein